MDWMNAAPDWIKQWGAIAVALIVLVTALSQLRDALVKNGFVNEGGWVARTSTRTQVRTARSILTELGLDSSRAATVRRRSYLDKMSLDRPDRLFLAVAQGWIFELKNGYTYNQQSFYLDIMGAMAAQNTWTIPQIMEAWIRRLVTRGEVDGFDVILTPKDGNVLLGRAVAEKFDVPLVLVKGEKDKSRIIDPRDVGKPHESDFEGLREVINDISKDVYRKGRYAALIVDDSCANGSQIASCAVRYNRFTSDWNRLTGHKVGVEFTPIGYSVILFRFLKGDLNNKPLEESGVKLHSLVALGSSELASLKALRNAPGPVRLKGSLRKYKNDSSCRVSLAISSDDVVISDEQPTAQPDSEDPAAKGEG